MSESRRFDRLPVEIEVNVTADSDHNFYTGFTQNISEGGIFVATSQLSEMGATLEFAFRLNDVETQVRGIVRWVREASASGPGVEPGMGIEFVGLDPALQRRINDFIAQKRDSIFFDMD